MFHWGYNRENKASFGVPLPSTAEVYFRRPFVHFQNSLFLLTPNKMEQKRLKISFEYSNPNTHPVVSVIVAIFGIVLVIGVIFLCILLM